MTNPNDDLRGVPWPGAGRGRDGAEVTSGERVALAAVRVAAVPFVAVGIAVWVVAAVASALVEVAALAFRRPAKSTPKTLAAPPKA